MELGTRQAQVKTWRWRWRWKWKYKRPKAPNLHEEHDAHATLLIGGKVGRAFHAQSEVQWADEKWRVQMIVMRRVSESGGTRWHARLCCWWGVGAHQRARARESTCPEGARQDMMVHVSWAWGQQLLFLPRFPLIFAPSLFPRELHSPLSQLLSISVTLLFICYPFFNLFIIFLFLLASVKVTLFLLFTIKGQFSHFNSQSTIHTLFSFLEFFYKIKIYFCLPGVKKRDKNKEVYL